MTQKDRNTDTSGWRVSSGGGLGAPLEVGEELHHPAGAHLLILILMEKGQRRWSSVLDAPLGKVLGIMWEKENWGEEGSKGWGVDGWTQLFSCFPSQQRGEGGG